MKSITSFVLGIIANVVIAQKSPDVIYCNDFQNVAIVMDTPIAQAVTGSEDFVFSYNQTAEDSLGLLQGRPGKDSNLLVRTTDGGLYHYILKYKDTLTQFVHFIDPVFRINSIQTIKNGDEENKVKIFSKGISNSTFMEKLSTYYLNRNPHRIALKSKDKIKLEVQGLYYFQEKVYMVLNIQNRSNIDFRINTLNLTKIHGLNRRKSSYQELEIQNLHRKGFPVVVRSGKNARFVMVYPKVTLGDHETLKLFLNEKNGGRHIDLLIKKI
ncbi:DUF4138 domain-containing protein [Gramella sp. GC03-9]|uniref:DUF4138 domain-containing protein n=1 Tax=Christiangramia oceanisediminis TaxID=2920386 RepID=A0A9X2KZX3_9FLAO|nr:DUF4138 domain-containing protein [Gramella oceanisediminis]MCP9201299.1 DUF4138 domain-containing protein [Gramella oceanisediminis]